MATATTARSEGRIAKAPALLRDRRFTPYLVAAAVVLLAFLVVLGHYGRPVFPIDDAYITIHDAQVLMLHGGHDPNYLGVSALLGETSLVHLAFIALFTPVVGAVWGSYLVSWLAILLYALGVVYLARVARASRLVTALLVGVALTAGVMGYQLLNGMETGLVLATVTWMLALAYERRHYLILGLVCGVAPFVRPELVVLSALVVTYALWQVLLQNGGRRTLAVLLGAAAVAAVPWMLWSGIATGHFIPTTVSAKAAWFSEQGLPIDLKNHYLWDDFNPFVKQVGPLMLGFVALACFRFGRFLLAFVVIFYAAYWYRYSLELNYYFNRYQYVMVPLLLLGFAWLATHAVRNWRLAGGILIAATLIFTLVSFPGRWKDYTASRQFTVSELSSVAHWAQTHIPQHDTVMIHDAGYIAYGTDLHLVDMVGLKTPQAVTINQYHIRSTWAVSGRTQALLAFAHKERPQYLVALAFWDQVFDISGSLRSGGWQLRLVRQAPPAGYNIYSLTPPPARS